MRSMRSAFASPIFRSRCCVCYTHARARSWNAESQRDSSKHPDCSRMKHSACRGSKKLRFARSIRSYELCSTSTGPMISHGSRSSSENEDLRSGWCWRARSCKGSRMRIGALAVDPPVLLAPMAAVTDLPFRTIAEELGVGLTITEFLSAHALAVGDPKTTGKMTASLDGRRFGVQIFGREEGPMGDAARLAVAIGASLVDINMGCPAKRVVAGECGSALMKEPAMAQRLVRTVVDAVPPHVPVTVKHRAGWNQDHRNAPEF